MKESRTASKQDPALAALTSQQVGWWNWDHPQPPTHTHSELKPAMDSASSLHTGAHSPALPTPRLSLPAARVVPNHSPRGLGLGVQCCQPL